MSQEQLANSVTTTLNNAGGGIGTTDTSITVASVSGIPTPIGTCRAMLANATAQEIITFTGVTGNMLTGVTRHCEGTAAAAFTNGDSVVLFPLTALSLSLSNAPPQICTLSYDGSPAGASILTATLGVPTVVPFPLALVDTYGGFLTPGVIQAPQGYTHVQVAGHTEVVSGLGGMGQMRAAIFKGYAGHSQYKSFDADSRQAIPATAYAAIDDESGASAGSSLQPLGGTDYATDSVTIANNLSTLAAWIQALVNSPTPYIRMGAFGPMVPIQSDQETYALSYYLGGTAGQSLNIAMSSWLSAVFYKVPYTVTASSDQLGTLTSTANDVHLTGGTGGSVTVSTNPAGGGIPLTHRSIIQTKKTSFVTAAMCYEAPAARALGSSGTFKIFSGGAAGYSSGDTDTFAWRVLEPIVQ